MELGLERSGDEQGWGCLCSWEGLRSLGVCVIGGRGGLGMVVES